MKRLLDYDDLTGVETWFHSDGETVTFEDKQDVEPILEMNKLLYNDYDQRATHPGDGFHRVASIPNVVMIELWRQGILGPDMSVKDQPRFLKFLDDPENVYLRTRPGKLSK